MKYLKARELVSEILEAAQEAPPTYTPGEFYGNEIFGGRFGRITRGRQFNLDRANKYRNPGLGQAPENNPDLVMPGLSPFQPGNVVDKPIPQRQPRPPKPRQPEYNIA